MKMSIVKNERERILHRCNTELLKNKHNSIFDTILRDNGYPHQFIQRSHEVRLPSVRTNTNTVRNEPFYLKVPFINDSFNRRLKTVFRKQGVYVRFCYTNRSLRAHLTQRFDHHTCSLSNCKISASGLSFRTHVIYQITCNGCQLKYIGSTIRQLHVRVREHLQNSNSSVFQHLRICGPDISVRILAQDSDPINLRLKEALLIRDLTPQINSREELRELECLI